MRRRLALLVVATTSVVLLAFLLPLAMLVSRAASSDAVGEATARSQLVVAAVASGATAEELVDVRQALAVAGYRVRVRDAGASAPRRATVTRTADGAALVTQPVVVEGSTRVVETRVTRDQLRAGVDRAWFVLGLLGATLVALSLVVADRLARSMTRPITDLAGVAERLAHGDLTARTVPEGPDEVREVGEALNLLAGRIGELLAAEREQVADLSHRLRTPLTALRLDAESLPPGEDRDRLTAGVEDLSRQVDALIREARRPEREGVGAWCDATAVVAERVDFWSALAEEEGRTARLSLPPGPCPVRVAPADLEAAMDALLGNVLAHTPTGVDFTVSLTAADEGGAVLVVADEGPGLGDPAAVRRGRSGGGSTGLGLDIVRRTAVASGGGLTLGAGPTGGAAVTVRLGPPGRPGAQSGRSGSTATARNSSVK
jgi:signal transduction histidine kinase